MPGLNITDLTGTKDTIVSIAKFMDIRDFYELLKTSKSMRSQLEEGIWWRVYLKRYFAFLIPKTIVSWTKIEFERQFKDIFVKVNSSIEKVSIFGISIQEYLNVFTSKRLPLSLSYKGSLTDYNSEIFNNCIKEAAYYAAIRQDRDQFSKLITQLNPLEEDGFLDETLAYYNLLANAVYHEQIEVLEILLESKQFMDTMKTSNIERILETIEMPILLEKQNIKKIIHLLAGSPAFMEHITEEFERNYMVSFVYRSGIRNTFMAIKEEEDLKINKLKLEETDYVEGIVEGYEKRARLGS